ncbi:MAG: hypothetical protein LC747_07055, partial [Acidobacteria bacterium]|nr:hypothetical protein [Acidobacteriota bacterium]
TMVGRRLALNTGIRVLTIEAGWPRTPGDGIVRGGGLATARISHFGDPRAAVELLLVQSAEDGSPRWLILDATGAQEAAAPLEEERVRQHVAKLLH